jgi:sugar/nucleoside kinase (ribokinase family)
MMTVCDVLCYGGIAIDNLITLPHQPRPDTAMMSCTEDYRLGGGAAHTAGWLAAWGVPTRLSGNAVGRDEYGDRVWGWLSAYGVLDLTCLDRRDDIRTPTGRSVIFPDGHRYLLCFDFVGAPMRLPAPDLLAGVKIAAVNFYAMNPEPSSAELARLAARMGVAVVATDVIDPGHEMLGIASVVINSAAATRDQVPGADVNQHARRLHEICGRTIIVTDSDREVYAISPDGRACSAVPPRVGVVDTTGAGDAFRAGVIYGMLQGWPLERTIGWAAATGSLQVQRSGPQDQPAPLQAVEVLAGTIQVSEAL